MSNKNVEPTKICLSSVENWFRMLGQLPKLKPNACLTFLIFGGWVTRVFATKQYFLANLKTVEFEPNLHPTFLIFEGWVQMIETGAQLPVQNFLNQTKNGWQSLKTSTSQCMQRISMTNLDQ